MKDSTDSDEAEFRGDNLDARKRSKTNKQQRHFGVAHHCLTRQGTGESSQTEIRVVHPEAPAPDTEGTEEAENCITESTDVETHHVAPEQANNHVTPPRYAEQHAETAETGLLQPEDDAEISLEDPETNQEGSHDAQDDDNQLQGDGIRLVQPVQDQEQNMNAAVRVGGPRICGRGIRGIRVRGGGLGLNRGRGRGVRHAKNNPAPLAPQVPPNAVIWQWNRIYPRGPFRPRQIPFTGRQRIMANLPRNPTPQDFFKLYITEEIIDHLVTQTNLYAAQYIEREHDNLGPRSTVHQWIPTSRPEMLTLIGILILMGILHKPRMALYWSTDKLLATPIFSQVMRRDRFFLLLRFLHFADNRNYNQNDPGRDKLFKVREVMNMIKRGCSEVFSPGKYLTMDESLVLFKGRLSFKQ